MKEATFMALRANLKSLLLSSMAGELETHLRQARESGIDYDEFLLELTTLELQSRAENRLNRRVRGAKFPLLKTMETFDPKAAPDLDIRMFRTAGLRIHPGAKKCHLTGP